MAHARCGTLISALVRPGEPENGVCNMTGALRRHALGLAPRRAPAVAGKIFFAGFLRLLLCKQRTPRPLQRKLA